MNNLPTRPSLGTPLQVSKWLTCPMLIDDLEMEKLFLALGTFDIYLISGILAAGSEHLSHAEFLNCYRHYTTQLKSGSLSQDPRIGPYFSSIFTCTKDALYAVPVIGGRQLIKVDKPVVQLQAHRFSYGVDKKFRSMVLGPDSISWGIQFSFPQLYQNEKMEVVTIRESDEFPNFKLFKTLQKWVRDNTAPTPFLVDGEKVNVPIRLGKSCFAWINHHPQLLKHNIQVNVALT